MAEWHKRSNAYFCHFASLTFCLSAFLPFCLSGFLPFCLFAFLPFCLSGFLSFCLFASLPFRQVCDDVHLVFDNATRYNRAGTDVYVMADTLTQRWEERWQTQMVPKLAEEVTWHPLISPHWQLEAP